MKRSLSIAAQNFQMIDLPSLLGKHLASLPYSLRVVAENVARQDPSGVGLQAVVERSGGAVPFRPLRLVLQDMLGLPLLVDIMALRSAVAKAGGDVSRIDMSLPVALMIDHAATINYWAQGDAFSKNEARECAVNHERFSFMKACETRFENLTIIPPSGGIIHQVNLEYLADCVGRLTSPEGPLLAPDSCFGTDSHTTMINGLGVLGWGIGGLEAEAIMFGEAATINVPRVIGVELSGTPDQRITATDIALTMTEKLRGLGVVDCFVELFGPGYASLSVEDRATIANMAPEYGATCVYCPVDDNTLKFLRSSGRSAEQVMIVEAYMQAQQLWSSGATQNISYDQVVPFDLAAVKRSVAGPGRPEQRVELTEVAQTLTSGEELQRRKGGKLPDSDRSLADGDVIIAAITSCTNTANPVNMLTAGLVAKKAVEKGLRSQPHVKTSLAPGSRVVARYLEHSGLQPYLDQLGFQLTSFSCSTCGGLSGQLDPVYSDLIKKHKLNCVAVLSGNRNFPGRIHPLATRNVLASPPLVVAYALAGTLAIDISSSPLGYDQCEKPVFLDDLWPSPEEVTELLEQHLSPEDFRQVYAGIREVNPHWNALETDSGDYQWPFSTYVTWPGYLHGIEPQVEELGSWTGLRPLVVLGDSITTDHITPAGTIPVGSAAADFLDQHNVAVSDYNAYGTRRGSSDIIVRSTFSNIRLQNEMVVGKEGSWTRIMPEGKESRIYEAIAAYQQRNQPLVVIAGKNYGCGSSRDTAAKAPWLAGIRVVIAESFERIHRSNLVNMGIAPLQFPAGVTRRTLELDGSEVFDVKFVPDLNGVELKIHRTNGCCDEIELDLRLYNDNERETFRQGGLLSRTYRNFVGTAQ